MPKCMAPSCQNSFSMERGHKKRKMSFFQIPDARKNPKKIGLALKWLRFCQIAPQELGCFIFGKHRAVCVDHFDPRLIEHLDFVKNGYKRCHTKRLKRGTYPTLLSPGQPAEQDGYQGDSDEECAMDVSASMMTVGEDEGPDIIPSELPPAKQPKSMKNQPVWVPSGDKPLSRVERPNVDQAASIARWPPDLLIPAKQLNHFLTCGLCSGYFYNATTITTCLHTFCKSCLVKHFCRSLHCPVCNTMVHPSDPYVNARHDSILQDLVYRIFKNKLTEDQEAEREFYKSRGLPLPQQLEPGEEEPDKPSDSLQMVSVVLQYAGTTPSMPAHHSLKKCFLRLPSNTTIRNIQHFLQYKMRLPLCSQAALFSNFTMIHPSFSLQRVGQVLGESTVCDSNDLMLLQFGVIPKGEYFRDGLVINTKDVGVQR